LVLVLCATGAVAQPKNTLKKEAKAYLAANHYEDAIRTLEQSRQLVKSDEESRFLLAVCYFQLNNLAQAQQLLGELTTTEKSPYPECWLYLGKIYHAQQQFARAAEHYKLYLRTLRSEDSNRRMIIEEIRRCDNGVRLVFGEAPAVVENLGPQVNSTADEFAPLLSPSRSSQLYFSAVRPGNTGGPRDKHARPDEQYGQELSDMFTTTLEGGAWQAAQPLHYLLNSPQHEYLCGFANEGQVLLYYQGWNWEKGEIFADTFQQNAQRSLRTTPFLAPARGNAGEYQLYLAADTLLLFASRRPGGYGGLDLYRSALRNGRWTAPENLGPEINSAYDETTPFLARDGVTLYFSTNNSSISVGGLDVVQAVYLPGAARWSAPRNLGFPINSSADDAHFSLARDGFTGFFSSARKDGQGQRDLYIAYFTKYRQEMELPVGAASVAVPPAPAVVQPPAAPPRVVAAPVSAPVSAPPLAAAPAAQWSVSGSSLSGLGVPAWLAEVAGKARQYPTDYLVLTGYVPFQGNQPLTVQFFEAMEQLQEYSRQLQQQGVAATRIFLRTLRSTDPAFTVAATFAPLTYPALRPAVPVLGQTTRSERTAASDQVLVYKVQVVSVQKAYANAALDQQPELMLENAANLPYLRYTAGATPTFKVAEGLRRQLVRDGYSGAYIVPYFCGVRLDKDQARTLVEQFPDLNEFLGR